MCLSSSTSDHAIWHELFIPRCQESTRSSEHQNRDQAIKQKQQCCFSPMKGAALARNWRKYCNREKGSFLETFFSSNSGFPWLLLCCSLTSYICYEYFFPTNQFKQGEVMITQKGWQVELGDGVQVTNASETTESTDLPLSFWVENNFWNVTSKKSYKSIENNNIKHQVHIQ